MLMVERVARLRRVELFSATPDKVLAGVAAVVDEVSFETGQVIMEMGAVEDWLFVLLDGEVTVARPDRTLTIGAGSVVGEFAVLDPQPRTATVTAASPVHAFRLRKPAFDDVLRDRPEIAAGVITELVRRLRQRHEQP